MTIQSGKNILVSYKAQAGLGTPASGAGATGLRMTPSPGLQLQKQIITSNEVRRDGQKTRGRHGTKSVTGSYQGELSAGGTWDTLIAAALRSSFAAAVVINSATMTSVTAPTTSTIVANSGSWITQGVRVGDMVKLTGSGTAANDGKWYRVTIVTATTITVAGTPLVVDAVADTTGSLTIAKACISGAAPVEQYFTFEEYGQDIDASPTFTDCKITKLEVSAQPNAPVVVTITIMGLNAVSVTGASAPLFTTPTYTTTLPLVMSDGTVRINGVDYGNVLTGFSLAYDAGGQTPGVLAPNAPDVFLSNAMLSGSFSVMRQDTSFFDAFNSETQIDLFVHCCENTTDPKSFVAFYVGNATYSGDSGQLGNDGALIDTIPWNAGIDSAGGSRALTTLKVTTG